MFNNDEDFRRVLLLDHSWWTSRGFSMTPWSDELVIKSTREVRIHCFGVPLHARCPKTFKAIGQQWGEVLLIDFGSVESGCLDDGRIKLLTDVVIPLFAAFKLSVDGKFFDCWVMEDRLVEMHLVRGSHDSAELSGSRRPWEEDGRDMVGRLRQRRSILEWDADFKIRMCYRFLLMVIGTVPVLSPCRDGEGLEDGKMGEEGLSSERVSRVNSCLEEVGVGGLTNREGIGPVVICRHSEVVKDLDFRPALSSR
ncbi:hypothetical protein Dimus_008601 [Dionaea muscipula]